MLAVGRGSRQRDADGACDLQQQRRLADARLTAEQDEGPADDAATEDAVDLADPYRTPLGVTALPDVGERCGSRDAGRGRGTSLRARTFLGRPNERLDERVPAAARSALALPAEEGAAARLTDVATLCARHRASAATGRDGQTASTGVFSSAAPIVRPVSSGILSTRMVAPCS